MKNNTDTYLRFRYCQWSGLRSDRRSSARGNVRTNRTYRRSEAALACMMEWVMCPPGYDILRLVMPGKKGLKTPGLVL